jgi:DNA primase
MDSAADIKTRLDIVDLVGEYVTLKPAGSGAFKACCPFHHERSPSFFVSRTRQSWRCFGCNEGGDHFTFIEKIEGMEFREALGFLAQKAGVILPEYDAKQSGDRHRLHEVNMLAAKFFQSALQTLPQAEHARAYLKKRGVDELTTDLFKIGYAPEGWQSLTDALLKKDVTPDELLRAGLVSKRERGEGVYDRFRDRLMFPILDVQGNVLGFTGRVLQADAKEAKYVNTPETAVYRKSGVLYGLDKAKAEIRRADLAVLVEGNMDVVSSHQFGVTNVVACSGTALTSEQLHLLKRFTTNLAIAFDADSAGRTATIRGLDLARTQDFSIKIITLPPDAGKDPDDAVRKDVAIWRTAIQSAVSIMDWLYAQAFIHEKELHTPEGKKRIAQELLPEIRRIIDPVERDSWIQRLAQDLGVGEASLREALQRTAAAAKVQTAMQPAAAVLPKQPPKPKAGPSRSLEQERFLLGALLANPAIFSLFQGTLQWKPEEFEIPAHASLYEKLVAAYNLPQIQGSTHTGLRAGSPLSLPSELDSEERDAFEAAAFLAEQDLLTQTAASLERTVRALVASVRSERLTQRRRLLEEAMRQAERIGDQAAIADLMRQFQDLH